MNDLISLPFQVQLTLGVGYLAYVFAYRGIRRGHSAQDVVFITLAFSAVAAGMLMVLPHEWSLLATAPLASLATIVLAGLWRRWLRGWMIRLSQKARISGDDGLPSAWDSLLAIPNMVVGQLSVHTKDGRILYQNQRAPYFDGMPLGGMVLGSDGDIVMVVEDEELPDGTEEKREGIVDAAWGLRLTYIPADQVARVNIRAK